MAKSGKNGNLAKPGTLTQSLNLMSFRDSSNADLVDVDGQGSSQDEIKCLSKLARTSLSGMHQYVEFLFRESEASKKISFCANSKKSLMSNSTDKLHSPTTVYYESDDEESNFFQQITNQTKAGL